MTLLPYIILYAVGVVGGIAIGYGLALRQAE